MGAETQLTRLRCVESMEVAPGDEAGSSGDSGTGTTLEESKRRLTVMNPKPFPLSNTLFFIRDKDETMGSYVFMGTIQTYDIYYVWNIGTI